VSERCFFICQNDSASEGFAGVYVEQRKKPVEWFWQQNENQKLTIEYLAYLPKGKGAKL